MAKSSMKLPDIQARAEAAFKQKADRRAQTMDAWRAYEDRAQSTRDKTAKLRELRLAREVANPTVAPVLKVPATRRTKAR